MSTTDTDESLKTIGLFIRRVSETWGEHDRMAHQYRVRRHWGPRRLTAARERE